jgi:hypothetical protein
MRDRVDLRVFERFMVVVLILTRACVWLMESGSALCGALVKNRSNLTERHVASKRLGMATATVACLHQATRMIQACKSLII